MGTDTYYIRTPRLTRNDTYIAFMMDHAAGNHPESFALAADLHVALNPDGAETADIWSMIGGVLLESSDIAETGGTVYAHKRVQSRKSGLSAAGLLAQPMESLKWRRGLSGVQYASAGAPGTKFMKLDPGQSAPMHGHGDLEATVVLSGRFSDGHGTYSRGDLVLGQPGMRHKPSAVGEEACVCFVAHRPNNFWRIFQ